MLILNIERLFRDIDDISQDDFMEPKEDDDFEDDEDEPRRMGTEMTKSNMILKMPEIANPMIAQPIMKLNNTGTSWNRRVLMVDDEIL